jgi:AhpD family alkylhydroperoxidase
MGNSPHLLSGFLTFSETLRKGSFSNKEQEAIALAVSQANECDYCLAAHTVLAQMSGFTETETIGLRMGSILHDKLKPLTQLAIELTKNRGAASEEAIKRFYAAGYDEAALADLIGLVALRSITNYIYSQGDFETDFPKVKVIAEPIAA